MLNMRVSSLQNRKWVGCCVIGSIGLVEIVLPKGLAKAFWEMQHVDVDGKSQDACG
jgi:hypothetical protein